MYARKQRLQLCVLCVHIPSSTPFHRGFTAKPRLLELQKRVFVKLTEQNPNRNKTLEEDRRPENLLGFVDNFIMFETTARRNVYAGVCRITICWSCVYNMLAPRKLYVY
jgi:hypothetical protein